jgi:hypothetical protein
MDGPTAVDHLTQLLIPWPQIRDVRLLAMLPGETIESSSNRLQYYAQEVLPHVRDNLRAQRSMEGDEGATDARVR